MFKGTLKESSYDLQTFYGPITLPVDKVVGIINIGQFRPREAFGYQRRADHRRAFEEGVDPVGDVQRPGDADSAQPDFAGGYRKRVGEPEEWTFEKPMVLLRTGERIIVQMPLEPIDVVTRYGKLSLMPAQVAGVQLQNEDNSVHEIELTDGSRFSGLLTADSFNMKLDTGGAVQFPVSTISRLQLTSKVKESDETTPLIKLEQR